MPSAVSRMTWKQVIVNGVVWGLVMGLMAVIGAVGYSEYLRYTNQCFCERNK